MTSAIAGGWRIGAGFNPGYLNNTDKGLSLPDDVAHLELGFSELLKWNKASVDDNRDLSLHLARTPITESFDSQDQYIEALMNGIPREEKSVRQKLVSVGLHLTGSRSEGIGRLGFSSHYYPSEKAERNAIRFIDKVQERTGLSVWLENANFYSRSYKDIYASWKSTEKISRKSGAKLIVDLSHLIIDAANIGLSEEVLLGLVPWGDVKELHLSGIVEGNDGAVHDGHSLPVHERVWALLGKVKACLPESGDEIIVTIEHSDPVWVKNQTLHDADFEKLRGELRESKGVEKVSMADKSEVYAKSYLMRLLKQWIPNVEPACKQRMISYEDLVLDWLKEVAERKGSRIVMTQEELLLNGAESVEVASLSFSEFARRRIQQCDAA
jgi:hypothetical protein